MKYVIAIDFGGTSSKGAIVSAEGKIIARSQHPTNRFSGEGVVQTILNVMNDLKAAAKKRAIKINRIGLGSPGPVDPIRGVILKAPNLKIRKNFPIRAVLEKKSELKVVVENDANLAALGEAWLGAGRGEKVVVMITLGTGIGGGVVIDDKIFSGAFGVGAELGHIAIDNSRVVDGAGHSGCFEGLASATAVIKAGQKKISLKIKTAKEVADLARQGHKGAQLIFNDVGFAIGRAVGSLINIFNPSVFIIGGQMSKAMPLFKKSMLKGAQSIGFESLIKQVKFTRPALADNSGIIGAARLALD